MEVYSKMIRRSEKIHSETEETRKKMIRDEQDRNKQKKIQSKFEKLQVHHSMMREKHRTADYTKRRKLLVSQSIEKKN